MHFQLENCSTKGFCKFSICVSISILAQHLNTLKLIEVFSISVWFRFSEFTLIILKIQICSFVSIEPISVLAVHLVSTVTSLVLMESFYTRLCTVQVDQNVEVCPVTAWSRRWYCLNLNSPNRWLFSNNHHYMKVSSVGHEQSKGWGFLLSPDPLRGFWKHMMNSLLFLFFGCRLNCVSKRTLNYKLQNKRVIWCFISFHLWC